MANDTALRPGELQDVLLRERASANLAACFLVTLAVASRAARQAGLRGGIMLEAFALAVPAVLLGSRLPALAAEYPAFLHDANALASAILAPASTWLGTLAGVLVAAAFAWGSGRPRVLADAAAPAATWMLGGVLSLRAASLPAASGIAAAALITGAVAGMLARRFPGRGRGAVLAVLAGAALLAADALMVRHAG